MKEIKCAEVGFFPDCDGVMQGATDEEATAASLYAERVGCNAGILSASLDSRLTHRKWLIPSG